MASTRRYKIRLLWIAFETLVILISKTLFTYFMTCETLFYNIISILPYIALNAQTRISVKVRKISIAAGTIIYVWSKARNTRLMALLTGLV